MIRNLNTYFTNSNRSPWQTFQNLWHITLNDVSIHYFCNVYYVTRASNILSLPQYQSSELKVWFWVFVPLWAKSQCLMEPKGPRHPQKSRDGLLMPPVIASDQKWLLHSNIPYDVMMDQWLVISWSVCHTFWRLFSNRFSRRWRQYFLFSTDPRPHTRVSTVQLQCNASLYNTQLC